MCWVPYSFRLLFLNRWCSACARGQRSPGWAHMEGAMTFSSFVPTLPPLTKQWGSHLDQNQGREWSPGLGACVFRLRS